MVTVESRAEQLNRVPNDVLYGYIADAQKGDAGAWERLYDIYQPKFQAYFNRRLGNPTEAEDLTAETFSRWVVKLGTYDHQAGVPFGSWAFTVARNILADHFRRIKGRPVTYELGQSHPNLETTDRIVDPFDLERAKAAIQHLSPRQKEVIQARFLLDRDVQETADLLHTTPNNVKVFQHKAIVKMRKEMQVS